MPCTVHCCGIVWHQQLVATDTDAQHTFVETENVRYVYQPVEQLYTLLITNKSSNIIEDLDTLRLIVKLVCNNAAVAGQLSGFNAASCSGLCNCVLFFSHS